MKNFVKMLGVCSVSVLVGLAACKDDDPLSCQNGTFEMTLNGELVTATSFNNTLVKGSSGGADGRRMDIRATDAQGRELIITFTDLANGTSGNCVSTDEYISVSEVTTGTENAFMFTIIQDNVSFFFIEGNLDITGCNSDSKHVSGTFSFSDDGVEVTNGSFKNMCYRISG